MQSRLLSVSSALGVSALFYASSSTPAQAYLDPGTGSMVLQVLLGGLAGLALAGRFYWQRFLTLIGVRSSTPQPEDGVRDAAARDPRADR